MRHPILWRIMWREYLVYSLLFTLMGCFWIVDRGTGGLVPIFWLKLIGVGAIGLYLWFWRMKFFYLFFNLGLGKRHIIALFLGSDLILSTPICLVAFFLRPYFPDLIPV